ncbi:MAG: protein jag [Anaerolineales bacterium]|nr:MAG: protein jag [Anaerolineales bacterium]
MEQERKGKRSVELSSKDVEEAIAQGLAELGRTRDEVEIEVLSEGSRGLFGLGAEEARVRISVIEPQVVGKYVEEIEVEEEKKVRELAAPLLEKDFQQMARGILKELLAKMGVRAQVVIRQKVDAEEGEPPPVVLDIVGDDLGILIGRRGETLAALQYITRLLVSRKTRRWYPLVVDVEQYKVRRERSLRRLAQQMAERVSFSRQPIALEAMSAYERRIVHIALRNHPSVTTESVGEGDERKVTIIPKT